MSWFNSRSNRSPLGVAIEEVANANTALRQEDARKAAISYERAAKAYGKVNQTSEQSKYLLEAARIYASVDINEAVRVMSTVINGFVVQGQLRRAATHASNLADICKDGNHLSQAMYWYEKSAIWFEKEGSTLLSNKSFIAYADISALNGEALRAAEVYQKVSEKSLGTPSASWTVKEYCERAVLSMLIAKEFAQATEQRLRFCSWDRSFEASIENANLERVIHAVAGNELTQFENAMFEWDQESRLSDWMVRASLIIKRQMSDEELL